MHRRLPLTVAQKRQLSLMLENGRGYGWLSTTVETDHEFSAIELSRRLARFVESHEALRSRTVELGDEFRQVIEPVDADHPVDSAHIVDCAGASDPIAHVENAARSLPLDTNHGSYRLIIGRLRRRTIVKLLIHHLFADAVALSTLTSDLRSMLTPGEVHISRPSAQLSDLPTPLLKTIETPSLRRWTRTLGQAPSGSPFEFLPAYESLPHHGVEMELTPDSTGSLKAQSRRSRISLAGLINAAIAILLRSYDPTSSPVIQTVLSNRFTRKESTVVANLTNSSYVVTPPHDGVADLINGTWTGHLAAIRSGWFDRLELDDALRYTSDNRYTADISAISNIRTVSTEQVKPSASHPGKGPDHLWSLPDLIPPVDPCRSRNTHLHVFAGIGPSTVHLRVYTSDALTRCRSPWQVANDLSRCLEAMADERQQLSDVQVERLR
ncbi:condensation domain-containing protein [Kribbella speibonae]|uniref:Condensation domain-containing protein n=1 Tax=Kribbella speibonae TaxID=1572660 RepID=A0A4R0IRB9_9ACTN|nr:condensation domain-containing protein [Kribbella speibonae]TCC36321.1 hypothetical protein E0H92_27095 [Kribbella speibonae]